MSRWGLNGSAGVEPPTRLLLTVIAEVPVNVVGVAAGALEHDVRVVLGGPPYPPPALPPALPHVAVLVAHVLVRVLAEREATHRLVLRRVLLVQERLVVGVLVLGRPVQVLPHRRRHRLHHQVVADGALLKRGKS